MNKLYHYPAGYRVVGSIPVLYLEPPLLYV